jgi:hypothetical protein
VRVRLTDQAAVAVALARQAAVAPPTAAHLLVGLATEPEGRAGRRLRERATAAARLRAAADAPAPPLDAVLARAATVATGRAATTVDLLDAAIAVGGEDVAELLERAGYQRDLDGWLAGDPDEDWFDDAETYGLRPHGDDLLDPGAARVVAQVRAVGGGAVEVLVAGIAAPDAGLDGPDPRILADIARRLRSDAPGWDAGLDAVLGAVVDAGAGPASVHDLVQAAVLAGGNGPSLLLQLAAGKEP